MFIVSQQTLSFSEEQGKTLEITSRDIHLTLHTSKTGGTMVIIQVDYIFLSQNSKRFSTKKVNISLNILLTYSNFQQSKLNFTGDDFREDS